MADLDTTAALQAALNDEQQALTGLLPRIDDATWQGGKRADGWTVHDIVAHMADSTYGLSLLVLGEVKPSLELDERGWLKADGHNAERRAKLAALPRAKIESRLQASFDYARRAIDATADLNAPGPYGAIHTRGRWLNRIVEHLHEHRGDLEKLLAV